MLNQYVQSDIVVDLVGQYVVLGKLESFDEKFLKLSNADVHDFRDSSTTRELYIVDAKVHGIRVNRKELLVQRSDVVCISRLDDVIE